MCLSIKRQVGSMGADSAGQIGLDLVINKNDFDRQLKGIQTTAKKAGAAIAAAFAVKKLVDFSTQCIKLGSDLQEVQNVVDVTFPSMSKQVNEFAKNAISQFGLSETMAKRFTGTFGAMAKSFGFNEQAAYEMSTALTGLAGDVASFYNISQDEAYTKLKSVFTGETESLKDLGVVMTQAALDQYALANGYGKTTAAMSEAEKVALRYNFVQQQLTAAAGDFVRTSDSWANQVRVLNLQFSSLKATIGQGLINVFTPVLKVINSVIAKLQSLADAFLAVTNLFSGKKQKTSGMGQVVQDASEAAGAVGGIGDAAKGAAGAAKKAAKDMARAFSIDELNIVSPEPESGGGGGAAGGAGGGVSGGLEPVPVDTTALDTMDARLMEVLQKWQQALQPTIDAFKRLGEALEPLKQFAAQALLDFYEHFLKPVAAWTLGEGLPRFIDAITNGLEKINWQPINDALVTLWDALARFSTDVVGEGLLWIWENVLVPLASWTISNIAPLFFEALAAAFSIVNNAAEALQPLWQWLWDYLFLPLAQWTGGIAISILQQLVGALESFSAWCGNNQGVIQAVTGIVAAFFGAWKIVEITSFIQQSGGLVGVFSTITGAIKTCTWAKVSDMAQTVALNVMYAKDFVAAVASGITALVKQAAQFAINTAAKAADAVAQAAMTAATVAWNAVCTLATTLTTALGAAISFLTSPIGLVIVAITALIAAGVMLYTHWDEVKAFALAVWEEIKNCISSVVEAIKEVISNVLSAIKRIWENVWNGIKQFVTNIWNAIKSMIATVFEDVSLFISSKLEFISTLWITIWTAIKDFVNSIWEGIKNIISSLIDSIHQKISTVMDGIKNGISTALENIKKAWSDTWENLKKKTEDIFNNIWTTIKGIINNIIGGVEKMVNNVVRAINKMIEAVNSVADHVPGIDDELIPEIPELSLPRLAQGGYVKANTPRLAVIGDNRREGEIVSPESKLLDMAQTAARMAAGGGSSEQMERMIELLEKIISLIEALDLVVNVDIREIHRKLKDLDKRTGYSLRTT